MGQAYASTDDFYAQGLPSDAFTGVDSGDVTAALLSASGVADSYLRKRYALPLQAASWGAELTIAVVKIAQYELLAFRGFVPGSGAQEISKDRYDEAMSWLRDVSKGLAEVGCIDASPLVEEDGSLATSNSNCGTSFAMVTGPRRRNGGYW